MPIEGCKIHTHCGLCSARGEREVVRAVKAVCKCCFKLGY